MTKLSQALRLTCSFGSTSDPIAYTLYSILLAAVADGGGEAVDGGVRLRVSSSGLASQLGVTIQRLYKSLNLLVGCQLLNFQDKRRGNLRLLEVEIFYSDTGNSYADSEDLAGKARQERGMHGGICPPDTKKEKETKEESSPRTPFIEERKEKKKESCRKRERERHARETSGEKEDPSKSPRQGRLAGSGTDPKAAGARASVEERRKQFWAAVQAFASTYTAEELQSFYLHWARCDQATGVMDFEADPKFELQFYLMTWHLNRPMFQRGSGGAGRGRGRGSVAAEVSAEQERQQKRIREQEASLKVVRERERLQSEMKVVPPVFLKLMKDEGRNLGEVTADEIFTLLGLRRDSRTLSPEQTQVFNEWESRRSRTAEALRRMESG